MVKVVRRRKKEYVEKTFFWNNYFHIYQFNFYEYKTMKIICCTYEKNEISKCFYCRTSRCEICEILHAYGYTVLNSSLVEKP